MLFIDIVEVFRRPKVTRTASLSEKLGGYQSYQQAYTRVIHRVCGHSTTGQWYYLQNSPKCGLDNSHRIREV